MRSYCTIKSKQTEKINLKRSGNHNKKVRKQVASQLYLAGHTSIISAGYIGTSMHAQMKHTFCKSTRFNPYFGRQNYEQHKSAKVGIKSYRFTRECVSFVHTWMYLPNWNCVCMISYVDIARLLLVSLLLLQSLLLF